MKLRPPLLPNPGGMSHSARSAWIETSMTVSTFPPPESRTPQGVRGLKRCPGVAPFDDFTSHSARSAWIETTWNNLKPRKTKKSHSARSAWIETSMTVSTFPAGEVALRKECVD